MTPITTELKVSAFLAYKSIAKGNKGTTLLTSLIMALAFVNLMFMSSLFTGLTDAAEDPVIETLYSNIVIEPKDEETYIKNPDSILKKAGASPEFSEYRRSTSPPRPSHTMRRSGHGPCARLIPMMRSW